MFHCPKTCQDWHISMFDPANQVLKLNSLVMRSSLDARADLVLSCKLDRSLNVFRISDGSDKDWNQALLTSSIPRLVNVTRVITVLPCCFIQLSERCPLYRLQLTCVYITARLVCTKVCIRPVCCYSCAQRFVIERVMAWGRDRMCAY